MMIDNVKGSEIMYVMYMNRNIEKTRIYYEKIQPQYALRCTFIICKAVLRQLLHTAFDLLQVNCLMFK